MQSRNHPAREVGRSFPLGLAKNSVGESLSELLVPLFFPDWSQLDITVAEPGLALLLEGDSALTLAGRSANRMHTVCGCERNDPCNNPSIGYKRFPVVLTKQGRVVRKAVDVLMGQELGTIAQPHQSFEAGIFRNEVQFRPQ